MDKNIEKIVHFVDFENVHHHIPIDEIARGSHQQVILFVGNQQKIPNEWLIVEYNITVIRVGRTSKDNLDFHLSAYLGMVHVGRDIASVRFIIWSADTGFDDLIEHFKSRKRRIERKPPHSKSKKPSKTPKKKSTVVPKKSVNDKKKAMSTDQPAKKRAASTPIDSGDPTIKQVGDRVIEILGKTAVAKRPRKQTTLENQIEDWRAGIGFKHIPWDIVHWLIQKKHIEINDGKVKYNF